MEQTIVVDIGLNTMFILCSTQILTFCCPIVSSSPLHAGETETLGFKHYSDTNVVASQRRISLSKCVQSNDLILQLPLFIFISHIIVVKRLLDDNKNAIIIHFVSCIVELVTFNQ